MKLHELNSIEGSTHRRKVAASSVMKEKAIEMKKAIDNQMTWEAFLWS